MNDKIVSTKLSGGNFFLKLKEALPKLPQGWSVWILIWSLIVVVIGLNIWVGGLYWAQSKSLEYFESSTFKALLASILIPLLMSSISRALKIDEKVEAEKKQIEHEKKDRQYAAIKQTNAMWMELFSLSTEVAYFNADGGKNSPRALRKKLESFANSAEEVISVWYQNFPRLKPDDTDKFLPGMNTLFLSASSVVEAIERNDPEAGALQNCLLIIQDGVRLAFHYQLMLIFNLEIEGRADEVTRQIAALRGSGEYYRTLLKDQEPNFPPGEATQIFSAKRNKVKAWYQQYMEMQKNLPEEKRDKLIPASPETDDYYNAIHQIPFEQLGLARKQPFSTRQMKVLATEIFFQNDSRNLRVNLMV